MKKQTLLRIGVVATTLLTALWVHIEWLYVRNRIFTRDSSSLELGLPTGGEFTTNKFLYEELRHRRYRPWMLTRFSFDTLWKEVERRHKDIKLILIKDGLVKSRSFGQEIMAPIKYRKELELLRTVVKVHKLPDVLFLLNIRTFGIDNGNKRSQVPIFSLARDVNSTDLLFPNPYFMEWSERIPQLLNASTVRFPWKDRIAQAFWRGQCQCPQYSQPRVSLVSMADSPLLDVAFAPPHLNCRKQLWPEAEQDTISTLRATEKLFYTKMAAYKYLIVMPGALGMGYSKSLQYFGFLGSTLLVWDDNTQMEFYHHSLREGVHFLRVNASTLLPTIQRLRNNDTLAYTLGQNVKKWFETYLSFASVTGYAAELLEWYSKRQSFTPTTDMLNSDLVDSGETIRPAAHECRVDKKSKAMITQ